MLSTRYIRGCFLSQLSQKVSHHPPACRTRVSTLWLANDTLPIRLLVFAQFGLKTCFFLKDNKLWCHPTALLLHCCCWPFPAKVGDQWVREHRLVLLWPLQTIPRLYDMQPYGPWTRKKWVQKILRERNFPSFFEINWWLLLDGKARGCRIYPQNLASFKGRKSKRTTCYVWGSRNKAGVKRTQRTGLCSEREKDLGRRI